MKVDMWTKSEKQYAWMFVVDFFGGVRVRTPCTLPLDPPLLLEFEHLYPVNCRALIETWQEHKIQEVKVQSESQTYCETY